jgi:hypothetical protein
MYTTSNEIGNTLGVAVMGAVVVQQFAGNILAQLSQRGVAGTESSNVANKIAAAGAQAGHNQLLTQLPLSAAEVQQVINQAFVDALHGSMLISSLILLAGAVLVAVAFKQAQPASTIDPAEEAQGTLGAPVIAAVDTKER